MQEIEINGYKINPQHYIDKWTKIALEATPTTDKEVVNNIKLLYKKSNLKEPQEVVVYRDYEKFLKHNWDSVWDSVGTSVRASVGTSVWDSVWDSVGTSVRASVRASVGDSVWDSVGTSVGTSVRASVWASVGTSVWDSVWDSVYNGIYYRADDLAFADVFSDTKVLSEEKIAELAEYKQILCSYRVACLFENVAVVLVAPTIRRNEEGRLHNDQRPAVEWENNTGQYYLDGVNFKKDLWQRVISKEMSLSEIMQIEISDQRTVALKYNPQAIIKENAVLLHKDDRTNELYLVQNSEINTLTGFPKMYFVKMTCPTGRVFIEGVDPSVVEAMDKPDATEAQAWLCGLVKSDYLLMNMES